MQTEGQGDEGSKVEAPRTGVTSIVALRAAVPTVIGRTVPQSATDTPLLIYLDWPGPCARPPAGHARPEKFVCTLQGL